MTVDMEDRHRRGGRERERAEARNKREESCLAQGGTISGRESCHKMEMEYRNCCYSMGKENGGRGPRSAIS